MTNALSLRGLLYAFKQEDVAIKKTKEETLWQCNTLNYMSGECAFLKAMITLRQMSRALDYIVFVETFIFFSYFLHTNSLIYERSHERAVLS